MILTLIIIVSFLSVISVQAYEWLCMEEGDRTPKTGNDFYLCKHDKCLTCINDNGFSANLANCFKSEPCSWSGGNVSTDPPQLTIFSPLENSKHNGKKVLMNLATNDMSKITFYDYNKEEWGTFCKSCKSFDKSKTFSEGWQHLLIKARRLSNGVSSEEDVHFLVDSKAPVFFMSKFLPKKKQYTHGEFGIVYTELGQLTHMKLIYGTDNDMREFNMGFCGTGKNQYCSATLDLSDFNGEDIKYYAIAQDHFNTVQSTVVENVHVDTVEPIIENHEYSVDGDNVHIMVDLDGAADVLYKDLTDDKPKWRKLCNEKQTEKTGNICDKTKRFKGKRDHTVIIRALDKADNYDEVSIKFFA